MSIHLSCFSLIVQRGPSAAAGSATMALAASHVACGDLCERRRGTRRGPLPAFVAACHVQGRGARPFAAILSRPAKGARGQCRAANRATTPPQPPASPPVSEERVLKQVLERARLALQRPPAGSAPAEGIVKGAGSGVHVLLEGTGTHLGMDVTWDLGYGPDGEFAESIVSSRVACRSGHAGNGRSIWECDFTGASGTLELDDRETATLCMWVRTGFWLSSAASDRLELKLLFPADRAPGAVYVGAQLVGGRVTAVVTLAASTWLPDSLAMCVCGDDETWQFGDWRWVPGAGMVAHTTTHLAAAGGNHTFAVGRVTAQALNDAVSAAAAYDLPAASAVLDASLGLPGGPGASTLVEAEWAASGHLLVRPTVDGAPCGLFILDTGASGLVITRDAADHASLASFGEIYVTGVGGKVRSRFRQATTLALGGVSIPSPLFMEMELAGVVAGASSAVAGIIGYDLFRRVIVAVPRRPPGPYPCPAVLTLYSRDGYHPPAPLSWLPLAIISGVPHVTARLCLAGTHDESEDDSGVEELLMLDSGAGGTDCILNARAASRLLGVAGEAGTLTSIRGVGPGAGGPPSPSPSPQSQLRVRRHGQAKLELRLGGRPFGRLAVLSAIGPGVELSAYSAGMLCGELLARCAVVYDYEGRRASFQAEEGRESEQ